MNDAQQPTTEAPKPELNLADLGAMRNLIEVVTQRGAFKANELSAAGVLFDKLDSFLKAAEAAQTQQSAQAQPEASNTPEGE
jgi:hypothetical protein